MARSSSFEPRAALDRLGVLEPARSALATYLELVNVWNQKVNLTGARTADALVDVLVAPVLPALPWIEGGPLLDVGSGNGSPGLVVAVLRPELAVTLLEPRARRWAFLREAARRVKPDVAVVRGRHDGYPGPAAHTVLLRALRLSLAELLRLIEPGGRVLVFGRPPSGAPGFAPEATAVPALHVFRRERST